MAEYIEREAAIDRLEKLFQLQAATARAIIEAIPSADVRKVRWGKWIEKPYLLGTSRFCSLCGSNYGMPHEVFNYCPYCGAKMDGGNDG